MARRTASRPLLPFLCAMAATVIGAPAAEARITLSDGHVDVGAARIVGGQLHSYVKDASGGSVVWREPESVTLRVVDRAWVRLPSGMDSVGPKGQTVWMIPQVQKN